MTWILTRGEASTVGELMALLAELDPNDRVFAQSDFEPGPLVINPVAFGGNGAAYNPQSLTGMWLIQESGSPILLPPLEPTPPAIRAPWWRWRPRRTP